jgi:hypothetical protein
MKVWVLHLAFLVTLLFERQERVRCAGGSGSNIPGHAADTSYSNDVQQLKAEKRKAEAVRLLQNKKNTQKAKESNDYLETLAPEISWYYLPLIMLDQTPAFDSGKGFKNLVFGQDNTLVNTRGNPIGRLKNTCIASTNLQCTWTIWSALLGSQGCTFTAQGIYIRGEGSFGVPPDQFVTITGGTGQCRGITGEIKISPRNLELIPPTWDFEVFYDLEH